MEPAIMIGKSYHMDRLTCDDKGFYPECNNSYGLNLSPLGFDNHLIPIFNTSHFSKFFAHLTENLRFCLDEPREPSCENTCLPMFRNPVGCTYKRISWVACGKCIRPSFKYFYSRVNSLVGHQILLYRAL